jgi:hypothetical protein
VRPNRSRHHGVHRCFMGAAISKSVIITVVVRRVVWRLVRSYISRIVITVIFVVMVIAIVFIILRVCRGMGELLRPKLFRAFAKDVPSFTMPDNMLGSLPPVPVFVMQTKITSIRICGPHICYLVCTDVFARIKVPLCACASYLLV